MNFLYKIRNFQRVLEEKNEAKRELEQFKIDAANNINALEEKAWNLLEENSKLKDSNLKIDVVKEQLKEELNSSKMEIAAVKDELKKANTANGGYKKSNNEYKKKNEELKKQVSELSKQIEVLKSDRYLVRKVPSGRTPTQKINHIPGMKNSVRKFMKENFD